MLRSTASSQVRDLSAKAILMGGLQEVFASSPDRLCWRNLRWCRLARLGRNCLTISIAPGWELSWDRTRDWLFVKIRRNGPEADGAPPLAEQIGILAEQASVFQLVLELDEIDVLFSYLIGQLIMLHKRVWAKGGKIRLCGLSQRNQKPSICAAWMIVFLLIPPTKRRFPPELAIIGGRSNTGVACVPESRLDWRRPSFSLVRDTADSRLCRSVQ